MDTAIINYKKEKIINLIVYMYCDYKHYLNEYLYSYSIIRTQLNCTQLILIICTLIKLYACSVYV